MIGKACYLQSLRAYLAPARWSATACSDHSPRGGDTDREKDGAARRSRSRDRARSHRTCAGSARRGHGRRRGRAAPPNAALCVNGSLADRPRPPAARAPGRDCTFGAYARAAMSGRSRRAIDPAQPRSALPSLAAKPGVAPAISLMFKLRSSPTRGGPGARSCRKALNLSRGFGSELVTTIEFVAERPAGPQLAWSETRGARF
jgi:hypothetical protein